jgi:hypothetical protein
MKAHASIYGLAMLSIIAMGCDSESTSDLRSRLEILENQVRMESQAHMKPGGDGYSIIKTDLGILTVNIDDVKPYASGSRVRLKIGNLTSATITGADAKIEYGKLLDNGDPDYSNPRSRKIKISAPLQPGHWNNVSVTLEAIQPTELGWVIFSEFNHSGLRLMLP